MRWKITRNIKRAWRDTNIQLTLTDGQHICVISFNSSLETVEVGTKTTNVCKLHFKLAATAIWWVQSRLTLASWVIRRHNWIKWVKGDNVEPARAEVGQNHSCTSLNDSNRPHPQHNKCQMASGMQPDIVARTAIHACPWQYNYANI